MESNLNEQEINRRNAVIQMRDLGIEPYPAEMYEVNAKAAEILQNYDGQKQNYQNVSVAGRIMSRRIMGAAAFIELMDESGRIQVYVKRDEICPGEDKTLYNTVFKKLLDIGDILYQDPGFCRKPFRSREILRNPLFQVLRLAYIDNLPLFVQESVDSGIVGQYFYLFR